MKGVYIFAGFMVVVGCVWLGAIVLGKITQKVFKSKTEKKKVDG